MRQLDAALGSASPRAKVALTAFAGMANEPTALAAGFHRHVPKPFDPLAIVQILEEMLLESV